MSDRDPSKTGERGGCLGLTARALGVAMLLVAVLLTVSFVSDVIAEEPEITENPVGNFALFLVLVPAVAISGFQLRRWGRRQTVIRPETAIEGQVTPPVPSSSAENIHAELRRVQRSARLNQMRAVALIFLLTIAVIGGVVVRVGVTVDETAVAVSGGVMAVLAGAAAAAILWSVRRQRPDQPVELGGDRWRFSNIAFSDREPTWRGWKHDVGVLTIDPGGQVELLGLEGGVTIGTPFSAAVHSHRYSYWPMVKVTGHTEGRRESIYLVVRGRPSSKGSVSQEQMAHESAMLARFINTGGDT